MLIDSMGNFIKNYADTCRADNDWAPLKKKKKKKKKENEYIKKK